MHYRIDRIDRIDSYKLRQTKEENMLSDIKFYSYFFLKEIIFTYCLVGHGISFGLHKRKAIDAPT